MITLYRDVRVLVTGHTGFKGAWLVSWLLAEGAEVMGLALSSEPGRPNLFDDLSLAGRMRSEIVDIRDAAAVQAAVAAYRPVSSFTSRPGPWYYDRLVPWINFVPVSADLHDLAGVRAWLAREPEASEAIAARGRALAAAITFDQALLDVAPRVIAHIRAPKA